MCTGGDGGFQVHASLTLRSHLPRFFLLVALATSACSSPLPKLEKYAQPGATSFQQEGRGAWSVGSSNTAASTIHVLEAYPDTEVQQRARLAQSELDFLETERTLRQKELLESAVDQSELLNEVALIGVDGSTLPSNAKPSDLRELLTQQALEAERTGEVGAALRLASTAVALEWTTPNRDEQKSLLTDPREIARRSNRRLALIDIASPAVAKKLQNGGDIVSSGNAAPFVDLRPRRTAIADAAALIEQMQTEHVDQPSLGQLHTAGVKEIIVVCQILKNNGVDISSEFIEQLVMNRVGDITGRTMPLLVAIDNAQHQLAGNSLPDGFALRAFAEGAAGSLDQRTSIVWPDEFAQYMRTAGKRYRGIGTIVARQPDGTIRLDPIPGGPGSQGGLRSEDILLAVDGQSVDDLDLNEITKLATDPSRDSISLLVQHKDGTTDSVTIELGPVIRPHATGWEQNGVSASGMPVWNWIADPKTRTAYLRLDGFRVGGDRAVRLALQKAQQQARALGGRLEGLVLDLRANGGGVVPIAEEVANLFLKTGTIFRSTDGRKRVHNESAQQSHSELAGMPLVILVDERSASAAELVAGLLQVKADALVLGDQTYGKGSIQSSFRAFSDDCMALITIGWYLLPPDSDDDTDDWRFVDRAKAPNTWGVEPNVFVPMSVAETDAAMKARTQWFSGIGRDQKQPSDTEVPDPTIQLALALIRARVLNLQ